MATAGGDRQVAGGKLLRDRSSRQRWKTLAASVRHAQFPAVDGEVCPQIYIYIYLNATPQETRTCFLVYSPSKFFLYTEPANTIGFLIHGFGKRSPDNRDDSRS